MKHKNECKQFSDDIVSLAYGVLPGDRKEKLKKHLEKCGKCRDELFSYMALLREIKGVQGIDSLPEAFWESNLSSIKSKIEGEKKEGFVGLSFRRTVGFSLIGAFAALCIVLFLLYTGPNVRHGPLNSRRQLADNSAMVSQLPSQAADQKIVAQIEILENLDVLEDILSIVESNANNHKQG